MQNYGDENGFSAYAQGIGAALPNTDLVPALVVASAYIDGLYGSKFPGVRTGGYDQFLQWPRTGARTADGFPIPADVVPKAVEYATYEAALRQLAKPGSLSPDFSPTSLVKRKKVGPLEKEFAVSEKTTAADVRPSFPVIDALLANLLTRQLPAILVV